GGPGPLQDLRGGGHGGHRAVRPRPGPLQEGSGAGRRARDVDDARFRGQEGPWRALKAAPPGSCHLPWRDDTRMRRARTAASLLATLPLVACEKQSPPTPQPPAKAPTPTPPPPPAQADTPLAAGGPWMSKAQAGKDLWATLKTSKGVIVVKLFSKDAPKTVAQFVGPATRAKGGVDPRAKQRKKTPPYDATEFPRLIPNFIC